MKRVIFDRIGDPEVLRLQDDTLPPPSEGQVRLAIDAIGLNRFEALFRRDAYFVSPDLPSPIGAEASGRVTACGPNVEGIAVGDRVTTLPLLPAIGTGVYATEANVPTEALVHALDGATPSQDAAFWCAYFTAYGLLDDPTAKAGDFVLATAASSSVGLALIQIARSRGLKLIATTRTAGKRDQLLDAGAHAVIVTQDEDLPDRIAEITEGKGVKVSADAVMGSGFTDVVKATAQGGSVRIYGTLGEPAMAGTRVDVDLFDIVAKPIKFFSVYEVLLNPDRRAAAEAHLREAFAEGSVSPTLDRTFGLDEIVEAHRYLENSTQFGKVIVLPKR